jgi:SAM domain (Sterile alpha motif)
VYVKGEDVDGSVFLWMSQEDLRDLNISMGNAKKLLNVIRELRVRFAVLFCFMI